MLNQFSRTKLLFGEEAVDSLFHKRVAVFGIGGVGGYVCEALVRSGIGRFDLIDDDVVCLTNLNRQLIATRKTIGRPKIEVMAERMREINPAVEIELHRSFYLPETAGDFDFTRYDYVVDAIDTVTGKIEIIMQAKKAGVPVISAMGCGNRLDPTKLVCSDLFKTTMDPLAKVMRHEMRKRRVRHLKVVWSTEKPTRPLMDMANSCLTHCVCPPDAAHKCTERRDIPGSTAFVPSAAGLIIASEIVRDLTGISVKK